MTDVPANLAKIQLDLKKHPELTQDFKVEIVAKMNNGFVGRLESSDLLNVPAEKNALSVGDVLTFSPQGTPVEYIPTRPPPRATPVNTSTTTNTSVRQGSCNIPKNC